MNRISAGDFHSVIVDCEGEVWVSGESKDGGLGIPRVTTTKKNKLRQLESFGKFQGVVCSGGSSMLLDEDGMIWGAGSNYYGQVSADPRNAIVPFTKFDEQLPPIRFAALSDHFVFIDENGSVWNGGANLYGQLGRGHKTSFMDKRAVLQKISDLPPMKYADCSILSSFLLSEEGEVYASGVSRTKLKEPKVEYVKYTHIPFEIPIMKLSTSIHVSGFVDVEGGVWLQGYSILDADSKVENIPPMKDIVVATGDIYLLDEEGNVWVSGTNDYGQLGLGNRKRTKNFTMIPNLPTIIQITAGKYHALFLDINGSLWGCGNNIQGELGMPDINKSFSPVKNPFAPLIVREAQHRAKSAYSAY